MGWLSQLPSLPSPRGGPPALGAGAAGAGAGADLPMGRSGSASSWSSPSAHVGPFAARRSACCCACNSILAETLRSSMSTSFCFSASIAALRATSRSALTRSTSARFSSSTAKRLSFSFRCARTSRRSSRRSARASRRALSRRAQAASWISCRAASRSFSKTTLSAATLPSRARCSSPCTRATCALSTNLRTARSCVSRSARRRYSACACSKGVSASRRARSR
mmetsp:Transcript_27912/g.70254  ORF Transcript_27912/g.70254 Transcript_27912/m.70254 type:complete len:223 (-) Transcript_27912:1089-1757(-)